MVFDQTQFLWIKVENFLEDVEGISPEDATEEYKKEIFHFFDNIINGYKLMGGK